MIYLERHVKKENIMLTNQIVSYRYDCKNILNRIFLTSERHGLIKVREKMMIESKMCTAPATG